MLLQDFFNRVYRPKRLLGKSANTVRLYNLSIRSFGKTLGTDPRLTDLTDTNVAIHLQRLLDAGRSPATANKDRAQLFTLWRHASRKGMVEGWPDLPPLTEPERVPKAWLPDEFAKLLAAADRQDGFFMSVPRSLWWTTILMVCLDTGERVSAVRNAKWEWLSGDWLHVPAEARKGGRRDRSYRLSTKTLGHLMAVKMVSPIEPFPWPYCQSYIWRLFGDLLKTAGLPSGARDKFHKIRRTTGSVAHAAGMDAQEVLDHQYRRTTQKYLDPRFSRDRQASDAVADFLANPKPNGRKSNSA